MFEFLSVGKSEHRRVIEMLSAYVDGELSARERARVDRHLAGCAGCRWEMETLRQTVGLLGQLPAVPVPRPFTVREMDVSRRAAPSPSRRAYAALRGATALAALLLAVVVAGDVFIHTAMRGAAPAMAPVREMAVPTRPPQPPAAATTPTVVADREAGKAEEEPANAYGATPAPMATPSPVPQGMAAAPPTATPEPVLGEGPAVEKAAEPHAIEATAAPLPAAAPHEASPTPTTEEPKAAPTATPRPTAAPPTPPATLRAGVGASPTPAAVAGAMAATPTAQAERQPQGAVAAGERLRLAPVRLAEAGLCLLVMVLAAVTVVVGRRS